MVLLALSYGIFHLLEYATGSKFVQYLTENSETIPIDQSFSYENMEKDIDQCKLILVGESHGFKEPSKFDIDFFKYLHKNHHVNHYIAELDFVQASFLNDYLASGDEELLSAALNKWAVEQGRNNKDYFNKYVELHKYYVQLPENEKFEIIGIDNIHDTELLSRYLRLFFTNTELENPETVDNKILLNQIDTLTTIYNNNPNTLFILSHLKSNLKYAQEQVGREEAMFKNFRSLYKYHHLENKKVYGFIGLYHVFQYRVNGKHPLASKIRQSDLGLEGKMLSINFMMNDSYMVMPSNKLPKFMRDKGKYTRMPVSADNILVIYIYGVKDFKRMTPLHSKSLVKMNGDDSPYAGSNRLNTTIQLLPVTDVFNITDKGKPYTQYTIFVRNSDWAEPMEK